jgi:hypothetical protein
MEKNILDGKDICSVNTINSMYAQGQIEIIDDKGDVYRLSVDVLLPILSEYVFETTMKRKFKHLINPITWQESKEQND